MATIIFKVFLASFAVFIVPFVRNNSDQSLLCSFITLNNEILRLFILPDLFLPHYTLITINDIIDFVKAQTGSKSVNDTDDIEADIGCAGDDFIEFIEAYSKKYKVDMTSYLWYFHHSEEGWSFFKSPDQRVDRIPIRPVDLLNFANSGKWNIEYPVHHIPGRRYDLMINMILIIVFSAFLIYKYLLH